MSLEKHISQNFESQGELEEPMFVRSLTEVCESAGTLTNKVISVNCCCSSEQQNSVLNAETGVINLIRQVETTRTWLRLMDCKLNDD